MDLQKFTSAYQPPIKLQVFKKRLLLLQVLRFVYNICCLFAKSCMTLCDPMDCSPPGSSLHEVSSVDKSKFLNPHGSQLCEKVTD